ncbi:TonB-dependent receptor [Microbulbifer hainanensis]|uniref:TonB-dependent receptor n=1 Tax=Microbulbifer hainanensis TaxID=2735675 RepID=UPI0018691F31|nr:TonB-dependent receptor [Microbulbifer hainanensis]
MEANSNYLEEVIVTAQKRAESLQDVPISVNALSNESLKSAGIDSLDEVKQLVPALNVYSASSPAMTSVVIRGAGTGASDPTLEPSVGIFVDGVFMPRSVFGLSDLVDVERVEVLMGPQGTLYGKNTNSGVLSVTTKGVPTDFEAEVESTLGDYNRRDLSLTIGDALTDTLGYRVAMNSRRRDGLVEDETSGKDISKIDRQSFRGQLFWQPDDSLAVRAIGYYSESRDAVSEPERAFNENSAFYGYASALATFAGQPVADPQGDDLKVAVTQPGGGRLEVKGASVQVDYDLSNGVRLSSISGYQVWEQSEVFFDSDMTALDFLTTNDQMDESSISQEFRITSPGGETVDWVGGLFYFDSDLHRGSQDEPFAVYGAGLPAIPGATAADLLYGQWLPFAGTGTVLDGLPISVPGDYALWENNYTSTSYAAFGQVTWNMTEATSLTAGLRYGQEEKEFNMHVSAYDADGTLYSMATDPLFVPYGISDGSYSGGYFVPLTSGALFNPDGVGPVNRVGDRKDSDVSGMLSLNHTIGEHLVYATVSTGSKSGGFNGSFGSATTEERAFDPEDTVSYEVGAKLEGLLDGRMRLNMAYFYTQYDDFQAATFDPATVQFVVMNAGKQVTQGVDLDLTYAVTDNLTLTTKVEYLDAIYEEFEGANCHVLAGGAGCDLSGKRMPFAPNWAGAVAADYVRTLASGADVYAHLGMSFRSDYMADPTYAPYAADVNYQVWDGRLGWRNDRWDFSLWGKNLTDEMYTQVTSNSVIAGLFAGSDAGASSLNYNRWFNEPRTFGITARYTF